MLSTVMDIVRPLNFRGKLRLVNLLLPDEGERETELFGNRVRLDLAEPIQRRIYAGAYERSETAVVQALLKPGMVVVDAGANIGYYTALAASKVGSSGKIFAFEPNAAARQRLEWMVELNALSQVRVQPFGLSDSDEERKLFSIFSATNNPTMIEHGQIIGTARVQTLDRFVAEMEIERIDFLKIDVEGWEPNILKGAEATLRQGRIKAILCEFNDYWLRENGSSNAELWKMICDAGLEPRWPGQQRPESQFFNALFAKS